MNKEKPIFPKVILFMAFLVGLLYGIFSDQMFNLIRPTKPGSAIVSSDDGWYYYGSLLILILGVAVVGWEIFRDLSKKK